MVQMGMTRKKNKKTKQLIDTTSDLMNERIIYSSSLVCE